MRARLLRNFLYPFCRVICFLVVSCTVIAQPHANFSATPTTGCAPLVVNFTDLSTGSPSAWKWDLGNGTVSFLQNPSGSYFTPGTYTIKLVVSNSSGADSLTKTQYITVNATPTVNFSGTPLTGCFPLRVQFTDLSQPISGTISTWLWDFGDGTTSSLQNPSHIYTAAGSYNVSLRVINSVGCAASITKTQYIQIATGVKADFTHSVSNSCTPPVTITFQNLSTGTGSLTYQWSFGDGGTSTATNPTHTYVVNGNFTITLIVTNSTGCSDTLIKVNDINLGAVNADFTTPANICQGMTFNLVNTSTPTPASVLWTFGDGTTSTVINPTKIYNTTGSFTIKMVANFGACKDSISKIITVLPKPTASFTADKTTYCKAPLTVNFTSTSSGATSYQWIFGDGGTSTIDNPTHTYNAAGSYDVTLIVTNAAGCTDTLVKPAYIVIQPAAITLLNLPDSGCAPLTVPFAATITSADPIVSYLWDFGDGTTSTLVNPTHTYTIPGVYTISLVVTTAGGCSDTTTYIRGVIVGQKPQVNFGATPRNACAYQTVAFTDSTLGNPDHWLWYFGDGSTSVDQNPGHHYNDTGYFTVTLIAWNNGCPDTVIFTNYIHILPPVAAFSTAPNCIDPFTRIFTDGSVAADSWSWDFGDGNTSIIQNPTHTYSATGYYTVRLIVTNNITGCSDTTSLNVNIVHEKADFIADQTQVCKGTPIIFTTQGVNFINIASYYWDFGDGTTSTSGSPVSHTYANSGVYTVSLKIVDILGCPDSLVKLLYITVFGPTAKFSNGNGCPNTLITFTDNSTTDGTHSIVQWVWAYGDGTVQTLSAPPFQHSYLAGGTYTVILKVTDSYGCSDSISKTITISQPVADFTGDTLSCSGNPINFTNLSTGNNLSYLWNFGDGTTSNAINPNHLFNTTGQFTISLTITDVLSGCSDQIIKANFVTIANPIARFAMSDSASTCPPLVVTFTNTSQNYISYNWDFGDGTTSASFSPTHFYSTAGTFVVTLTVTAQGGCIDKTTKTIIIKGPQGTFAYNNIIGCTPLTTNFLATTLNAATIVWDFDDGNTISTTNLSITHTYTIPGFYLPKMILIDNGGCQIAITGKDTIKVYGVKAFFSMDKTVFCDSASINFRDSSTTNDSIISWHWNFGDGTTSNVQNPSHTWLTTGNYTISLTVTTKQGCTDTYVSTTPINIYPSPDISITSISGACVPATIHFTGNINNQGSTTITWLWDFGNGATSTLQNPPDQVYPVAGIYMISLTATSSNGCSKTVQKTIQAFPIPAVIAAASGNLCRGQSVTLIATGADSYSWSPATGLSCTACASPIAKPDSTQQYVVVGTSLNGCTARDSVLLTVIQHNPMIVAKGDTICIGSSTTISASGADNYLWSPAAGLSSTTIAQPTATPTISTTYRVIGSDNAGCFKDTGYVYIQVNPLPTVDAGPDKTINVGQSVDLIPTPSLDAINATWTPIGTIIGSNYPAITVKPKQTTEYTIAVENQYGCKAEDHVTVFVLCNNANVFIPNTFSPNGDGMNDVFYPRGTGIFSIKTLRIFNRWGQVVFEQHDFQANDASKGWNGTFKGTALTPDIFVYTIDILCENNEILTYKGNVALIR
jgi:gliding motility-associated-like protein